VLPWKTLRAVQLPLFVSLLGACSFLADLDGYSEPESRGETVPDPSATPGEDGGQVTGGGSAPADASATDAAPSTTVGCTPGHTFCDDFDDGADDLSKRWDGITTAAGPLDLDATEAFSPQRALRAVLVSGTGVRSSALRKAFSTTRAEHAFGFQMWLEPPAPSPYTEINYALVLIRPAPAGVVNHGVSIIRYPSSLTLEYWRERTDGSYDNTMRTLADSYGWHAYVIRLDHTGATPRAMLEIDGAPAASIDLTGAAPTGLEIRLGLTYTYNATTTNTVRFDDVWFDAL
jgi:hypothetical protein